MPPRQYHVIVEPAFSHHEVSVADASQVRQVSVELEKGLESSIFGEYPFPYRFRIPAMETTLYGDADDFDDLADAAAMIVGHQDLKPREKLAVWSEVVAESRNTAHREPSYTEVADDAIFELLDEDDEE